MTSIAGEIHRPQLVREVRLVDGLDGIPTESEKLGHVLDRQDLAQTCHALAQPASHARIAVQPFDMLEPWSAPRACHAAAMHQEPSLRIQEGQIADPTGRYVLDRGRLFHAAAASRARYARIQLDPNFRPWPLRTRLKPPHRPDSVSVPAAKQSITLVKGHGSHLLSRSRQAASR